jgi:hypothetical protein
MAYEIVALGGGNACGYLAKELVALGLQPGKLAIITDEPVSTSDSGSSSDASIHAHDPLH